MGFFDFLKVITQQILKDCSKYHMEGVPQLAPQYENRAMTTQQEDRIFIEVEMDAQELFITKCDKRTIS